MFNQTKLSPMEEALFQSWARAHRVDDHNDLGNQFDYRGVYKQSNGTILPNGILNNMAMSHNDAMSKQGDVELPMDPLAAQVEMERVKQEGVNEQHANASKMQMEQMKMSHTSQEKEKDRQHKLMLEQMKAQQKAKDAEANRQARAQEAGQARQSHAAEAAQNRQASAEESQRNREAGVQDSVMQEHFARTRPQDTGGMPSGPANEPAPEATSGQPGGNGLRDQLLHRAMGGQQQQGMM